MTREYELADDVVKELIISGIGFANQMGVGQYLPKTENEANKAVDDWFAAHDAQMRAEALDFANEERIDNGRELLNESLSEAVKEYLLYGDHPLSTEEDSDDIWDDAELYNLKLTNGDVIDCSELAGEVLDALKRYLKGQPMLQSIPVKEQKQ